MTIREVGREVGRGLFVVAREAGEAAKNDPALALRVSATSLQDTLMTGVVNDSVKTGMSTTIVPLMRGALLAMNTVRCMETFKDPTSSKFDKGMDALRVATDLVGFAGGLAMLFTPAYAGLGAQLVGVSYAADLISHGYRGIQHVGRRIKYWEAKLAEDKPPEPTPPPRTSVTGLTGSFLLARS